MPARVAVSGSIATDHLMRFPGRFADQFIAGHLDRVSLSFLVDELVVRRGGVAANIAYGLAQLGLAPILVGAAGEDFADYHAWLARHGVDCGSVHVSRVAQTARFVCTTDLAECQIASFYPGAMAESAVIRLADVAARTGPLDLVLVGADDPAAMLTRAQECRQAGIPFAADPSQQLARMTDAQILDFITGAEYLVLNEYERALLATKTGLSDVEVAARIGIEVVTLGARGAIVRDRSRSTVEVPAPVPARVADPTGVGDAFRAGFFAAVLWGLPLRRAAELGCLIAGYAIETVGTQEYRIDDVALRARYSECYGGTAANEVWQARLVGAA